MSNMLQACYWIEWLIEFDLICRKRKQPCICKRRIVNVDNKYQCDVIWVVWDSLIYYSKNAKVNPQMAEKLLLSLKELYSQQNIHQEQQRNENFYCILTRIISCTNCCFVSG